MTDLPEPGAAARVHSERVTAHIRSDIASRNGRIPFSRYMDLALYAPGLGYYAAGATKLGAGGDFVTAPEMTPLFGKALATQVAAILAATRGREIVELGGGSGRLAVDLIAGLAELDALPSRYAILEPSPDLARRQRDTLARDAPNALERITWIDALPEAIDGALIANEVLDAVPVAIVARRGDAWLERGVTLGRRATRLHLGRSTGRRRALPRIAAARFPPHGDYTSEINMAAEALVGDIGRRITEGAALFIDYGFPAAEYYHPQRGEGTLMCHYRHRAHGDPFAWPGLDRHHRARRLHGDGRGGRAGRTRGRRLHRAGAIPDRVRDPRRACRAPAHPNRWRTSARRRRCRSCWRRPKWENCSKCWRSRNRTRSHGPVSAWSIAGTDCRNGTRKTNGVAHGNAHRHCQPRHGLAPRAACALPAAPHRRRHRARGRDEHEIRLTWREFDAYLNRCANALASLGVTRGDRVATVLPNRLQLLATYWACAKLGAVVVPLSPLLTAPGLASLLADSSPRVVIGSADQRAMLDEVRGSVASGAAPAWLLHDAAPDDERAGYRAFGTLIADASEADPGVAVEPGDLWTLMYTSGTTGMPKGIQHTHFIRAMYAARANSWRMLPESIVLHSGSIVFNGAMTTMLPAFMLGATFVRRARLRSGSCHRDYRARTRHSYHARAVADHRDPEREGLRSGAARLARNDPFAGRPAAPGDQGPARMHCCRGACTSSTG